MSESSSKADPQCIYSTIFPYSTTHTHTHTHHPSSQHGVVAIIAPLPPPSTRLRSAAQRSTLEYATRQAAVASQPALLLLLLLLLPCLC